MSKEALDKLNEKLLKHFKETGVKNAFYYEPIADYYWKQTHKIGLCNLESYDETLPGIHKVTYKTFLDIWSNSPTIKRSLKMFQAISWILENGGDINEQVIKSFDAKDFEKAIGEFGCGLYFNLRLTTGHQVNADKKAINDFYNDSFYIEYYKEFIKAAELNMLIVTGEIGVNAINRIFPELHLVWGNEMEAKEYENILFCPAPHPSREGYKKMAEDLNYFFDLYSSKIKRIQNIFFMPYEKTIPSKQYTIFILNKMLKTLFCLLDI